MKHCNKRHIFLCLLVFLLIITDRNEAIIVELKALFDFNVTFITFSGGSPTEGKNGSVLAIRMKIMEQNFSCHHRVPCCRPF